MENDCEYCMNLYYDEEYDCMCCSVPLDEDEMYAFLTQKGKRCRYFRQGDDYTIVRKQN